MKRLKKLTTITTLMCLMASFAAAWVPMGKANTGSFSSQGPAAYDYKVTVTSTGSLTFGDWIFIPGGVQVVSVTVAPQTPQLGTTAKVQTTTDPTYVVQLDTTNTTAIDWDDGVVSATTTAACLPVTAIRLVQTSSGTTTLSLRAQ